jgi:hypothetical protein
MVQNIGLKKKKKSPVVQLVQRKRRESKPANPQRTPKFDAATTKYVLALTDPFHPGASGARVPDMYAAPTDTLMLRASHTITVNSSGAAGIVCMPNVVASAYLYNGTSPEFLTTTYQDATTSTFSRWGATPATLAAKLDNYRIVGYGLRVTNMSSMTNVSGKVIMGSYPIDSNWATKDFPVGGATAPTNAAGTAAALNASIGIPLSSGSISPNLWVNYPGTQVRSGMELGEKAFEVVARPVDPRAFEFIGTNDGTDGFSTVGSAAAGATLAGNANYLSLCGHEALFVHIAGGVASTSAIDIEMVYHLEGRPNISAGTQSALTTSPTVMPSPVKPLLFMEAVAHAVSMPAVKEVIEYAAGFIHPLLGRIAKGFLSLF